MTTQHPTPTLAQARAWLLAHGWTPQEEPAAPQWTFWEKGDAEIHVPSSEARFGWLNALWAAATGIARVEGRACTCGAEIIAEMAAKEEAP